MSDHWATNSSTVLTGEDLRRLHDQGHDSHPEQPEHERLAGPETQS